MHPWQDRCEAADTMSSRSPVPGDTGTAPFIPVYGVHHTGRVPTRCPVGHHEGSEVGFTDASWPAGFAAEFDATSMQRRCNREQVGGESPRERRAIWEALASSGGDHFRPLRVREPFTTHASWRITKNASGDEADAYSGGRLGEVGCHTSAMSATLPYPIRWWRSA